MMIKRNAYHKLIDWKNSETRKPLVLRGARQVGKTTLVRDFAVNFDNYLELNLEREDDKRVFESDSVEVILNAIFLLKKKKKNDKPTLLFIDEIQEFPKAIQMLRYFYEEKPDLHVIAAGSLLEFAMKNVSSFPVGRVEYLYLHPINFEEYLGGIKHEEAEKVFNELPVPEYAHNTLLDLFHEYSVVGGMPEITSQFIKNKNVADLSKNYKALWQSYKEDVEKYAKNKTESKIIRHIIESAPFEKDRIKFEGFGNSNYRSREVGEALRALDLAKVIQLIYPTTELEPPFYSNLKKRPRLQFLDTGMLNQILSLQGEMLLAKDLNDFEKGRIIAHLVTQELISVHSDYVYKPNFWVRENKNSNSEVDLVYQSGKYLVPIEIKSGKQGTLKSLHQFVERTSHPYAVRVYSGKLSIEKHKTPGGKEYYLMNLPYYLSSKIKEYLSYFIHEFKF